MISASRTQRCSLVPRNILLNFHSFQMRKLMFMRLTNLLSHLKGSCVTLRFESQRMKIRQNIAEKCEGLHTLRRKFVTRKWVRCGTNCHATPRRVYWKLQNPFQTWPMHALTVLLIKSIEVCHETLLFQTQRYVILLNLIQIHVPLLLIKMAVFSIHSV